MKSECRALAEWEYDLVECVCLKNGDHRDFASMFMGMV